ncbi:MAG: hypothetical protein JXR15_13705 [Shimia sp.]|uniref:hypothetical protein n=1 Tax=Shimia sp. TaxID=1954381 RepID=UPI003B8E1FC2
MTVADCLDALRSDIPGCQVAAFGDVAAHLILKASHDAAVPRERLDGLCGEAARCFAASESLGDPKAATQDSIVLTAQDMRIYVRAQGRADFICVLCPLDCDPEIVVPKSIAALTKMAGDT